MKGNMILFASFKSNCSPPPSTLASPYQNTILLKLQFSHNWLGKTEIAGDPWILEGTGVSRENMTNHQSSWNTSALAVMRDNQQSKIKCLRPIGNWGGPGSIANDQFSLVECYVKQPYVLLMKLKAKWLYVSTSKSHLYH